MTSWHCQGRRIFSSRVPRHIDAECLVGSQLCSGANFVRFVIMEAPTNHPRYLLFAISSPTI